MSSGMHAIKPPRRRNWLTGLAGGRTFTTPALGDLIYAALLILIGMVVGVSLGVVLP